ncbi:LysR family transcriptional regulator [Rhodovastum atsumiense]|uniref:LysR family transcriptional regulator n=1 Tax=Rhodovastum atsumiense TaxID=504468 RepID=A0A5M6IQA4_9PROT|nr:LysR family transcriptional regulator [Rhodovastum atsumiense]KAA5610097.1 LysR family transcriptional regulator [Rhodovastum atsumiense]CAH2601431.1 LysR family transcriptional regulator [Rhodovastum atsumiense]
MQSQDIEIFLQLARHRNLSRAAEVTHLSQSTISKRLQMLEEKLGYHLLERGKGLKKVELTPQGEAFLPIAERWQELLREAHEVSWAQPRQHIVIGTVPSANMTFIPELCRRLWNRKPRLSYRTISLHSVEMYEEIEKRTIDVGFSLVEQTAQSVAVSPCFSVPLIGVRIRQGGARKVDVRSLDPEHCILVPWGTSYLAWHDYWFHSGKKPWATVDNPLILFAVIEHKEQWAVVPRGIAHAMLATGRFETFQIDPAPPERVFYKITHKTPRSSVALALQAFNEELAGTIHDGFPDIYTDFRDSRPATPTRRP